MNAATTGRAIDKAAIDNATASAIAIAPHRRAAADIVRRSGFFSDRNIRIANSLVVSVEVVATG